VYAVGVCCKRGGWIFIIYKCKGEAHPTLKVRRIESVRSEISKPSLETPLEVVENVGRFG